MARSEAVDKKAEISAQKRKVNIEENEEKREERRLVSFIFFQVNIVFVLTDFVGEN